MCIPWMFENVWKMLIHWFCNFIKRTHASVRVFHVVLFLTLRNVRLFATARFVNDFDWWLGKPSSVQQRFRRQCANNRHNNFDAYRFSIHCSVSICFLYQHFFLVNSFEFQSILRIFLCESFFLVYCRRNCLVVIINNAIDNSAGELLTGSLTWFHPMQTIAIMSAAQFIFIEISMWCKMPSNCLCKNHIIKIQFELKLLWTTFYE